MLPKCVKREAENAVTVRAILSAVRANGRKLEHLSIAVMGNGDTTDSLVARINRHAAYWKIFAILGALVAVGGTIAGVALAGK